MAIGGRASSTPRCGNDALHGSTSASEQFFGMLTVQLSTFPFSVKCSCGRFLCQSAPDISTIHRTISCDQAPQCDTDGFRFLLIRVHHALIHQDANQTQHISRLDAQIIGRSVLLLMPVKYQPLFVLFYHRILRTDQLIIVYRNAHRGDS